MDRNIYESMGLNTCEYEKIVEILGRKPNLTEVGMFAVMWSEHCGYKHSRAQFAKFPKSESVSDENAGCVEIDDLVVVFKVESHNHPSAVEPYHGAATGVGGVLRDIFTMGARPIAALNSLRFGSLAQEHSRYLFRNVVRGIADYGNIVGVPTVGGEVYFDDAFKLSPLVNAMAIGVAHKSKLTTSKPSRAGLTVLVAGGATGGEGIHGATFASVELGDGEKKPEKTQEGNPELERRLIEACLEAIDAGLIDAMQDMGAAGFTSSSCEMAAKGGLGIELVLDKVPLKTPGLTPYEIMLSESQERMLIIIEPENQKALKEIFDKHNVLLEVAGKTTDDGILRVVLNGETYAEVPASALTDAPLLHPDQKEPSYIKKLNVDVDLKEPDDYKEVFLKLLSDPDIASKEWIYNQFEYNSQNKTVLAPGGDGAVLDLEGTKKRLAVSLDCNSRLCYLDPEKGAELAVAEAARNIAVTGAKPLGVTDGLCFGNPEDPEVFYTFAKTIDGIAKACRELGVPVVSGNVSFYNESEGNAIYPTPVIGVVGVIEGENVTGIKPKEDNLLVVLGDNKGNSLNGSTYLKAIHGRVEGKVFAIDWEKEKALQSLLVEITEKGLINAAKDISDGGLVTTLAEMALASKLGFAIDIEAQANNAHVELFGEKPSRVVVSIDKTVLYAVKGIAEKNGVDFTVIGEVTGQSIDVSVNGSNLFSVELSELEVASDSLRLAMEA